ncbi:MAG: aldo/keto reductase [Fimbriimonadaceae bacterium]
MERRPLGKTGLEVSILGFGGAEIGYEDVEQSEVEQLLNAALDEGCNVLDTAAAYRDSEEKIGKAVKHRRDDFHLFTKCGNAGAKGEDDWSPKSLMHNIEDSLRNLQTDRVELIQLHSCGKDKLEQGDVIEVVQKAKEQGKTRFIGYSGDREDAIYALEQDVFDTLQISVNIADQEAIDEALPKAVEKNVGVIAKRPIANVAWQNGGNPPNREYAKEYWERLAELKYHFLAWDLEASVQQAMRFTAAAPGVATMIVGTTKPKRFPQNSRLIKPGALPDTEYKEIRQRWAKVAKSAWTGQT